MAITTHSITTRSQIADFKAFFDAVSDGVTESDGGTLLPAPTPVSASASSVVPGLADLTVTLDSLRQQVEALMTRLDSMQILQSNAEIAARGALDARGTADARAEAEARVAAELRAERDESMARLWQQMFETVDPLLEAERKLSVQAQTRATELELQLENRSAMASGIDMDALRDLITDAVRGHLGDQLLPQVEIERSARVAAETRAEESARRLEELQSNQRQNDADLRRQLAQTYEPQIESERTRRAQCEERIVELEKRLELDEQARRSAEIDLRDQSESLSILRTELAHLSEHKQQLEWESAQRNAATEQHEAMRLRLQAELDEQRSALEEAQRTITHLQASLSEVNLHLTQQKNENVALGRTVDGLRIDFGKKLEERSKEVEAMGALETELRQALQAAAAKATADRTSYTDNLNELNAKLAVERELNAAAAIKLEQYETQLAAENAAKATARPTATSAGQIPEFLDALPRSEIRTALPTATSAPTPFNIISASEIPTTKAAPAPRISAEAMAREKARLAILALGTAAAPAKLYFQSVPWTGLAVATVSVEAVEFGDAKSSLASFAVATATQQAIDASHSIHSSNSSRIN